MYFITFESLRFNFVRLYLSYTFSSHKKQTYTIVNCLLSETIFQPLLFCTFSLLNWTENCNGVSEHFKNFKSFISLHRSFSFVIKL